MCSRLGLYGIDTPGGMAPFVALPPEVLHAVPAGVDARTAALAEPLAVAVHAVDAVGHGARRHRRRLRRGPHRRAHRARRPARGRRHRGRSPSRARGVASVAEALGFTVVPEGVDHDLGARATSPTARARTRRSTPPPTRPSPPSSPRRRVCSAASSSSASTSSPRRSTCRPSASRSSRWSGVRVYTHAPTSTRAIELIASGALGLDRFPTKAFAVADVVAAFDAATTGQDCLKVLVTPLDGQADA